MTRENKIFALLRNYMKLDDSQFVSAEVIGLAHRVQMPATATPDNPAPLALMVHGYAGDETVMWVFRRAIPANMAIITPCGPLPCEDMAGYRWFRHRGERRVQPELDSLNETMAQLYYFITELPRHYPVDLKHLVMIGFSQGAVMCNSLAMMHPDLLRGVASLSGSMPDLPDIVPYPDLLADLPVFIAHGTQDETAPIKMAHYTRDSYRQLGAQVSYGEYNVGHKMSIQAIHALHAWLAKLI